MTIQGINSACDNFMGVGVQWDPSDNFDLTNEQWNLTYRRLEYMRVSFIRCMLRASYYCKGFDSNENPIYDWHSKEMKNTYKILDYCEKNHVTVIIGEWSKPQDLNITSSCDPKWIQMIGDFLEYMLPKYKCLKIYNYINEPDGEWGINDDGDSWEIWKKGICDLATELDRRHMREQILLTGPDVWCHIDWVDKVIEEIPDVIDIYNVHHYASDESILEDQIEKWVKEKRNLISDKVKEGLLKDFYMGEAGLVTGKDEHYDQQLRVKTFDYGVFMADYTLQSMRGGQKGLIMWMLDDIMHNAPNTQSHEDIFKIWGFWSSYSEEETKLRPWYYPVSLLSRYFPAGCCIKNIELSGAHTKAVCCVMDKGSQEYSVAIVHNEDSEKVVRIPLLNNEAMVELLQYNYFEKSRPTDDEGFPMAAKKIRVEGQQELEIIFPSRGFIVITSIKY